MGATSQWRAPKNWAWLRKATFARWGHTCWRCGGDGAESVDHVIPVCLGAVTTWAADGARERREAIRQLAGLSRRLATAEDALGDALAAMKTAEGAFDAASDRFDVAERALDAAREDRAQMRLDRSQLTVLARCGT